nr:RNA-directed DNA polymerase, eukaryota, reverse transcriptase zinc-binding domain protein [Tanacetum cinerariifolium]
MNPEPKVVTKHGKLLSSTQVNVKRVGTHFGAKEGVPGIIDDGMADGFDEEEGMEVVDDGTEDWLVSEEDLNIKKVKDEDGKKSEVSKGVFGNDYNFNVSVMFLELINDKMSRNSIDSSVIFDGMPEVPPPVMFSPKSNKVSDIGGMSSGSKFMNWDLFGGVKGSGWDHGVIQGISDSKSVMGESIGIKGMEMNGNENAKKPMSFSSVVQGDSHSDDNKLKWHLKRMWRPYQLDEIIMNEGGLYFFKFKSEDGFQSVIGNGPWLVDQKPLFVQRWVAGICLSKPEPARLPLWVKIYNVPLEAWNVEGISRIASRIGTPIIMDKVTTVMCQRGYERASFARVLIEVDAANGIVDTVKI